MPRRRAEPTDKNEAEIVKHLRSIPGVTVDVDHDDILVGYRGQNYWFEIKSPDVANKDGKVFESAKKDKQKRLEKEWQGHYRIVTTLDEILEDIFNVSVLMGLPIITEPSMTAGEALAKFVSEAFPMPTKEDKRGRK